MAITTAVAMASSEMRSVQLFLIDFDSVHDEWGIAMLSLAHLAALTPGKICKAAYQAAQEASK